jgi:hypothetical protein
MTPLLLKTQAPVEATSLNRAHPIDLYSTEIGLLASLARAETVRVRPSARVLAMDKKTDNED